MRDSQGREHGGVMGTPSGLGSMLTRQPQGGCTGSMPQFPHLGTWLGVRLDQSGQRSGGDAVTQAVSWRGNRDLWEHHRGAVDLGSWLGPQDVFSL